MPWSRASRGVRKPTSAPSRKNCPEVGWCTPAMILMSVDLPAPLSPTRQVTSPARAVREAPSSATTLPKRLVRSRATSSA